MSHVAPCGHPGEPIIGTYVKCLRGCDGTRKVAARCGEPGHVDACACRKCDIRRRASLIVYRSKDGRDAVRASWNGIAKQVSWEPLFTAHVRHWVLQDDTGAELARGNEDLFLQAGYLYGSNVELMLDKVVLSVEVLSRGRSIVAPPATCDRIARALDRAVRELERYVVLNPGRATEVYAALARANYQCAGGTREEALGMLVRRECYGDGRGILGTKLHLEVYRDGTYWAARVDVSVRP